VLDILFSHTNVVIQRLEDKVSSLARNSQAAKSLPNVANCLRRNQPYMDYAQYLRQGWPIGTGVIEGTYRHLVKDRMEVSGMRWTLSGAEVLLALPSANENGDWDDFHPFQRAQRHQRCTEHP
jgi:hypothetical protein